MGIKTPLVGLGMQPPQALGDTPLRIRETAPWEGGRYQKLVAMEEAMMGITRWVPPGTTGAGGASSAGKASVPSVLKTEDDRRNLCMQFALCESEAQVIQVLKHHGLWDDVSLWRYYGDRPNNFSVVGNQQAKPEAALVEKVTNAIDAVLMGECLRQGLHPEGSGAPATIREAVRNFFGVRDGELANLSAVERTELASRIMVVASGRKTSPCFSIIDTGEGQSPEQLPETLLSLNSTNKLRIHFVHGQFNQGGSGALPFCGDHNVQLIISRRDPEICRQRGDNDSWGFTILRRFDPAGGEKSSSYRYLTVGGAIPSFSGGTPLPLLPGDYPVAHALTFEHGTFIKLFDYKIGTKLRTNAVRDLTSRLSTLIPGAALPVRVLERRNGYQDRTEATLSGLNVRLAEDVNRILEPGFPASMSIHIDRQELGISIYAFKGDVAQDYVDGEGVIFTVSGHTHGSLPRAFFGRKTVGKGFLANSLLVVVDAS
jgi:hypothetical protein